ncbi:TolC family protein [Fluviicola sp.]|jgi:outer membrane protein|uniref:TolC family protein n=1 Tax=Fluviicola sp. TaxID=1917219 RepID=UPI00282010F3|nr:TolC family protein [Fluviicola sp.]MDR0803401.1 TolC family protein [Fluviicola sp.]
MKRALGIVFLWFCPGVCGQEVITLQSCLDRAESNLLQMITESALLKTSQLNNAFHWWSLLPNLDASAGFNTSFGRRLDPFTNTFATSSVNSQSFGLNSGMVLFKGLDYFHQRKMFTSSVRRDNVQLKSKQNELKMQVAELYILLCKLTAQLQLTDLRIEKYEQLQTLQCLLIGEGKIQAIDTLKSHNSLLNEQTLKLDLSDELKLKTIQLNFLMGTPFSTNYAFDPVSISAVSDKLQLTEHFTLESLEAESEITVNKLKSDQAALLPALSLNGFLGTGFSTNNKDYTLSGSPTKHYGDQLNQNLYEGIGLYLSIPLFSRGEWFKAKQLSAIRQEEICQQKQVTELVLEKQREELFQKRLNYTAKLEQIKQTTANLQAIYSMTLLLYEEGRVSYMEIETAFIEWQVKAVELEVLHLDLELLRLVE